jgi:hypothetical protein
MRSGAPSFAYLCPPEAEMRSRVTHADWSEARNTVETGPMPVHESFIVLQSIRQGRETIHE